MPKSWIPWTEFFEALETQRVGKRQQWLQLWRFNDPDVVLIPDILLPEGKVSGETAGSRGQKQERAAFSLITKRKQARILH